MCLLKEQSHGLSTVDPSDGCTLPKCSQTLFQLKDGKKRALLSDGEINGDFLIQGGGGGMVEG